MNEPDRSLEGAILFGFGSLKFMFGGIILCSNARTVLMRLVIPEAPSEWPTFGFTYCALASSRYDSWMILMSDTDPMKIPSCPNTFATAAASSGSPTTVPVP